MKKKILAPTISSEEAEKILQEVFLECYEDTNSIPVSQLEQYSNYRSERFSLQKVVAIAGFLFFLLIPIWFISPRFLVAQASGGERNLPVYTIQVQGILPIKSVTAVQDKYSLPVYQRKSRQFSVEPTANGKMLVCVTLFTGQWYSKEVLIDAIDSAPPEFIGTSREDDKVYVYLEDEDSGIDFKSAYLEDENGNKSLPESYNEAEGYLIIDENFTGTLHISDQAQNELTITIQNE